MSSTVLFVPDLHKRDNDFSSIKGYVKAVEEVQKDLLNYLRSLKTDNNYFISEGDWYDKGYRSVGRTYVDAHYDREIADSVNGNAYLCLGNHFFLERDSNPEMYLIQPSYLYKPKDDVPMTEPVFRTVPYLIIGNVQISFFHFNKVDKNYIQRVQPGVTFHIGVYHDDAVLPSDIRSSAGYHSSTSNDYLNNIYANIDMAICGHVHCAVGLRNYTLNSGKTIPIIVSGALAITENKDVVKHKTVSCPVLTIEDNGEFDMQYVQFSTHMEMLTFFKINENNSSPTDMEILGTGKGEAILNTAVSLRDFLRKKGYTERELSKIMSIQPGQTDVYSLWNMIREV